MNPDSYRDDLLMKKLCADVLMDHDSYREDVPMKRIHLISTLAHRTH
jgi:hypothetical protein